MTGSELLDAAVRRRSPATMPGFHYGRPQRNKGRTYPADPPAVEKIVAVMRYAGDRTTGLRTRALIVLLWRAGLRINEALSLAESTSMRLVAASSFDAAGRAPSPVGADAWDGSISTHGLRSTDDAHRRLAVRRRTANGRATLVRNCGSSHPPRSSSFCGCPPSLRSAAVAPRPRVRSHRSQRGRDGREGAPLVVIQRQLGHRNLGITSVYLEGIDSSEIVNTVHHRPPPVAPASAGLR
jgi:integrase